MRRTPEQRLLSRIEKQDQPDGCWIWRGSTKKRGYGQINVAGCQLGTHRVAYELWVGRKAVAALLLSAATVAVKAGYDKKEFQRGVELAWRLAAK